MHYINKLFKVGDYKWNPYIVYLFVFFVGWIQRKEDCWIIARGGQREDSGQCGTVDHVEV